MQKKKKVFAHAKKQKNDDRRCNKRHESISLHNSKQHSKSDSKVQFRHREKLYQFNEERSKRVVRNNKTSVNDVSDNERHVSDVEKRTDDDKNRQQHARKTRRSAKTKNHKFLQEATEINQSNHRIEKFHKIKKKKKSSNFENRETFIEKISKKLTSETNRF